MKTEVFTVEVQFYGLFCEVPVLKINISDWILDAA